MDVVNTCAIDESAFMLQSTIVNAEERSFPLKTASGTQNTPFWNSDLAKLRKMARRA
jgi:hypothetical protein